MVEFAGFSLPVRYGSILAEHRAVREAAGLFDVSHMGQLHLEGPGARAALEWLLCCPIATLGIGRVRYGMLLNHRGGVVDDLTVYRTGPGQFFLCVNAARRERVRAWVREQLAAESGGTGRSPAGGPVRIEDRSDTTALLALQGPRSPEVLERAFGVSTRDLRRFAFRPVELGGHRARLSRTGYTGEDGFEIYLAAEDAEPVFRALLDAGRPLGLLPAGLGARDTLRLEAALPLYGHELDEDTSPLEAGLERFVKFDGPEFLGAKALREQRARGPARRLCGFVLEDRGIARAGHAIVSEGCEIGRVTSGAPSPTLGKSIGLGYVPPPLARPGAGFRVRVRDRELRARVVEIPFVPPAHLRRAKVRED